MNLRILRTRNFAQAEHRSSYRKKRFRDADEGELSLSAQLRMEREYFENLEAEKKRKEGYK